MVEKFEATLESVRAARLDHIGARVDLEDITRELTDTVKVVDGMVRYGFGDNPEVMAEWKAAKSVLRGKATPPGQVRPGVSEGASPRSHVSTRTADICLVLGRTMPGQLGQRGLTANGRKRDLGITLPDRFRIAKPLLVSRQADD